MSRLDRYAGTLLVLSAMAITCWLWRPIQHENDIWWHLASGRYMVKNWTIPRADVFSSTATGHLWINHEWFFQFLAYLLFQMAGLTGVLLLKILLIVGAFALVERRLSLTKTPIFIQWGILAAAFWASRFGWNDRADLISVAFLAALMLGLTGARIDVDRKPPPTLWGWSLGFCLWANMHGGFVLGLAIAFAFSLGMMIECRRWMSSWGAWAILCAASTLLNPWGYLLHRSTLEGIFLLQNGFIREWMKTPWDPLELFWICLVVYWIVLGATMRRRQQIPWSLILPGLLLSWMAVQHVRNVPYFMLGAFPAASEDLSFWKRLPVSKWVKTKGNRWIIVEGVLTFLFAIYAAAHMRSGIDKRWQPVEACSFISDAQLPGHFYNDYSFGGYWMWYFGTTRPVFIDGRLHTVEGYAELYRRIETAQAGPPAGWEAFLHSYGIDAAMVSYPDKAPLPAVFEIYFPRTRWALVYWDDTAMIFLRRLPEYESWIRRYEFSAIDPEAQPAYVLSRMRDSSTLARQILEDLQRNTRLHPQSQRAREWLSLCGQGPAHQHGAL